MTAVREVPGVGRCLFASSDIPKGEDVLSETPVFISRPVDRPAIWALLERLHTEAPFGVGHAKSHYAAVRSYHSASQAACDVLLERWAPKADGRLSLDEMERVVAALQEEQLLGFEGSKPPEGRADEVLTAGLLQRLVTAWEFNGFSGDDGSSLLMYSNVSTASHSCDPNCDVVVLYGLFRKGEETSTPSESSKFMKKGDVFEQRYAGLRFRANRDIKSGTEISFSYCLSAEELALDFRERRSLLNQRGWNFLCGCARCTADARAFLGQADAGDEAEEEEEAGDVLGLFDSDDGQ